MLETNYNATILLGSAGIFFIDSRVELGLLAQALDNFMQINVEALRHPKNPVIKQVSFL